MVGLVFPSSVDFFFPPWNRKDLFGGRKMAHRREKHWEEYIFILDLFFFFFLVASVERYFILFFNPRFALATYGEN